MAASSTTSIDWYFDFVSPYSYICLHRLKEFSVPINLKPVLFAGLLNHWGQKGPAEIPAKRRWTYRWCTWWARELGVPFRFPASHPFNPLQHLRLAIAAGCTEEVVRRIFECIWTTGAEATDLDRFAALSGELGIDAAQFSDSKLPLRKGTDEAIARGVFGVPTFVVNGELFWGADCVDFVKAYLADPQLLAGEMQRLDALPVGASRIS